MNRFFSFHIALFAVLSLMLVAPALADTPAVAAKDAATDEAKQTEAKPDAAEAAADADGAAAVAKDGNTFKLPGLTANIEKGYVDVDATVCIDEGYLELIACTKDTKEHESLVMIDALPRHVHAALLLVGAVNGNPAMRKKVGEGEDTRWVHLPPRGEEIEVMLVVPDARGSENAFPISDFIMHMSQADDGHPQDHVFAEAEDVAFPSRFLFAGSHLVTPEGEEQAKYIADISGHVITISTFGDELLCLPGHHSAANGELVWQVNPQMLPKVGSKVKLRLQRVKTMQEPDLMRHDDMDEPGE